MESTAGLVKRARKPKKSHVFTPPRFLYFNFRKFFNRYYIRNVFVIKDLMVQNNYPNYIPFSQVIDGGETTVFKSLFSDWAD